MQPLEKDLVLDGTSIGGAVAASVGAEYKKAVLVTSRTFTTWPEAARGIVSQATNPVFGWIAKAAFSLTDQTKLDNISAMKKRFSDTHTVTILESVGVKGDGIISESAKLNEANLKKALPKDGEGAEIFYQNHVSSQKFPQDVYHHDSFIPLSERLHLYQNVIAPHTENLQAFKDITLFENRLKILQSQAAKLSNEWEPDRKEDKILETLNNLEKQLTRLVINTKDNPYATEIAKLADKIKEGIDSTRDSINAIHLNPTPYKILSELENRVNQVKMEVGILANNVNPRNAHKTLKSLQDKRKELQDIYGEIFSLARNLSSDYPNYKLIAEKANGITKDIHSAIEDINASLRKI